jgi:hypothetical protein
MVDNKHMTVGNGRGCLTGGVGPVRMAVWCPCGSELIGCASNETSQYDLADILDLPMDQIGLPYPGDSTNNFLKCFCTEEGAMHQVLHQIVCLRTAEQFKIYSIALEGMQENPLLCTCNNVLDKLFITVAHVCLGTL